MCTQTLYHHPCTHTAHGPLKSCGTLSVRGHQTSCTTVNHPTPCLACSTRPFSVPVSELSPFTIPTLFPSISPLPLAFAPSIVTPASAPPSYYRPTYFPGVF